jgi:cobalt-zinc-cadmium efflux system outer membrane protein
MRKNILGRRMRFIIIGLVLFCSGCTTVPPVDESCISSIVDYPLVWNRDEAPMFVAIPCNLTCDEAIQTALLNNPEIQSLFEEIGIAHADLIEAGLLQNPNFTGVVRFPQSKHATTFTEFSLIQNVLDLFLIPMRKKIASTELKQAQLMVAHKILIFIYEVQETYYKLQAELANLELMQEIVETAEAASLLAKNQKRAGNINDLELQSKVSAFLDMKVELSRNRIEIIHLREKMDKLLGVHMIESCWNISDQLPELPDQESSKEYLLEVAFANRLDLQVAMMERDKIASSFGLKQWWAYTDASIGVSTERDSEGIRETGPAFSLNIPLFNYGQADRARLSSVFRQSLDKIHALEISVLAEVRAARERLLVCRELVMEYKNEIIPLQQEIASSSQRHYNSMTLSVYKLLHAKKQQLKMDKDYNTALRDYWISKAALNLALGGHE